MTKVSRAYVFYGNAIKVANYLFGAEAFPTVLCKRPVTCPKSTRCLSGNLAEKQLASNGVPVTPDLIAQVITTTHRVSTRLICKEDV